MDTSIQTRAPERPLVRIGCAGLPPGLARHDYFRKLALLELEFPAAPPRPTVLERWRREAPPGCAYTLLLRTAALRAGEEGKQVWERARALARPLGAEVVLFQTPPSFSPSELHREGLRRFVGEVVGDPGDLVVAWEPRGLWEPEEAAKLAAELGLVYAYDPLPLDVEPPPAERAYFRLYGLGLYRNKISDDHLEVLAGILERYERSWVVFANANKLSDARRFRRMWETREAAAEEASEGDEDGDARDEDSVEAREAAEEASEGDEDGDARDEDSVEARDDHDANPGDDALDEPDSAERDDVIDDARDEDDPAGCDRDAARAPRDGRGDPGDD